MENIDQLRLIAQMSVSLAGFAGVVVSFQYLQAIKVTRGDALGLVMMVNISLVNSFFALLPIILSNFTIKEENTIWVICSTASAINYVIFLYYGQGKLKHVHMRRTITKLAHYFFMCLGVLAIIVNVLNAVYYREYALYFIILVMPITYTAYLFMRLVSRPVWRAIRNQEKDIS